MILKRLERKINSDMIYFDEKQCCLINEIFYISCPYVSKLLFSKKKKKNNISTRRLSNLDYFFVFFGVLEKQERLFFYLFDQVKIRPVVFLKIILYVKRKEVDCNYYYVIFHLLI